MSLLFNRFRKAAAEIRREEENAGIKAAAHDCQLNGEDDAWSDLTTRGGYDMVSKDVLQQAIQVAVESGSISTSMLQRKLRIGYASAGRIMDEMEQKGIISPAIGSKPREVLITQQQWVEMQRNPEPNINDAPNAKEEKPPYDPQLDHTLFLADEPFFSSFENTFVPKCDDESMYAAVQKIFDGLQYTKILFLNVEVIPFTEFNKHPRLCVPIIREPGKASEAIGWLLTEMVKRYQIFSDSSIRNIQQYNKRVLDQKLDGHILPRIMLIVDELSILNDSPENTDTLYRILAHGKSAGIHLLAFSYRDEKASNTKGISDLLYIQAPPYFPPLHNIGSEKSPVDVKTELSKIDDMTTDGWKFEKYAANLLLKNGFVSAEVTSGSNDYGVDVLAIDSNGVRYAIQCKCYTGKLGNSPVQEVSTGMTKYNCHVGIVLTNSYFTDNAIELAKSNNILLWDRDKLIQMIANLK